MSTELHFDHPELPPSLNKLYFVQGGRKVLSKAGRAFKNRFISSMGGQDAIAVMSFKADPLSPYQLDVWVYVDRDRLISKGYGTDKRVKYLFKDFDASNLIKLVEDSVAELTGLQGDRNNFDISVHKRVATSHERVTAHLTQSDLPEEPWTKARSSTPSSTTTGFFEKHYGGSTSSRRR